jgi:hypothetical protein
VASLHHVFIVATTVSSPHLKMNEELTNKNASYNKGATLVFLTTFWSLVYGAFCFYLKSSNAEAPCRMTVAHAVGYWLPQNPGKLPMDG